MKFLGNIIWLIFGGLHTAIEYFIAGLVLMITIIGIPFGHVHECAVVLCWRHLDLPHSYLLRPAALHHHHRHPLGKDALPAGKAGPVTIRNGSRIAHEQRRETRRETSSMTSTHKKTNYVWSHSSLGCSTSSLSMSGQQIGQGYKGIIIVNGKKVIQ